MTTAACSNVANPSQHHVHKAPSQWHDDAPRGCHACAFQTLESRAMASIILSLHLPRNKIMELKEVKQRKAINHGNPPEPAVCQGRNYQPLKKANSR
eukprot:352868-Chlamydomonas_euryale.AAC.3